MTRIPSQKGRRWTLIGLTLATLHLLLLSAVALFDGQTFAADFVERVPWLLIVALPGFLAIGGLREPVLLLVAGLISFPLAQLSLAGATLPLLLPAICYFLGYEASTRLQKEPP